MLEIVRLITDLTNRVAQLERKQSVKNLSSLKNTIEDVQIASGAFDLVRGKCYYRVESETGTSDNLDTVDDAVEGRLLFLTPLNSHTITVTESGNFNLGAATRVLDNEADVLFCIYNATITKWVEVAYADNA